MTKINVGLIGKGNWGKRLKSKLLKNTNLKFICGNKDNFLKKIKKNNIKWIFIATPNITHYEIVKKCINKNINVFCEKPLCLSTKKAQNLVNIAKKKKVKLFVSDLYNFYSNKIKKLNLTNKVFRSKYIKGNDNEFFNRFMYHDISILYKYLKKSKIRRCILKQNNRKKVSELKIELFNKKKITFIYNLNSYVKKHIINHKIIDSKKDYLNKMIINVLNNEYDISENNKKAIFIIKYITEIKKKVRDAN